MPSRITHLSRRSIPAKADHASRLAFSLIELLVVLAIIGILAAVALPNIKNFQPNVGANAARQLLGDINHARQLALSQHTTVYMVFVPTNYWDDPLGPNPSPPGSDPSSVYFQNSGRMASAAEASKASNLLTKQLVGYNYVTLHSLGDQPGHPTPRYLGPWRTLPDSAFIPLFKFNNPDTIPIPVNFYTNNGGALVTNCFPFRTTNNIPFPSEYNVSTNPANPINYITLPYIAFNYQGQLVNGQGQVTYSNSCELIPLSKGNVIYGRDSVTKVAQATTPTVVENPAGNTTNAFNVVDIDYLTGRARIDFPPVQ